MILPYVPEGESPASTPKQPPAPPRAARGEGGRGRRCRPRPGTPGRPAEREGVERIPISVPPPREAHPQGGEETHALLHRIHRGNNTAGTPGAERSDLGGGRTAGLGRSGAGSPPRLRSPEPESGAGGKIGNPQFCPRCRGKAMTPQRRSASPTCRHQHRREMGSPAAASPRPPPSGSGHHRPAAPGELPAPRPPPGSSLQPPR